MLSTYLCVFIQIFDENSCSYMVLLPKKTPLFLKTCEWAQSTNLRTLVTWTHGDSYCQSCWMIPHFQQIASTKYILTNLFWLVISKYSLLRVQSTQKTLFYEGVEKRWPTSSGKAQRHEMILAHSQQTHNSTDQLRIHWSS